MSFSVSQFLEKMESKDKDIRHMALYDLHNELQKDNFKLDESSQKQVADSVLKSLDDTSSEVQGMAVKCLGPFVKKLSNSQIESCVTKLSFNIMKGEDEKRDIATLALKTVVAKIPGDMASTVRKSLETLIEAVQGKQQEVKQDALEVLGDILSRFGALFIPYHERLQKAFIAELSSKRAPVRKRANACLAILSQYTSEKLFNELIQTVSTGISKSSAGGEALRTYIQAISGISRTAGYRLGKSLDKIFPLLWTASEQISEKEGEDEVREYIMQAFESFLTRCSEEVKDHAEYILVLCREYMEHDPNFSYDTDDDDKVDDKEDEEGEEDDGDDGDEDDVSWKVRTAAIKCLDTLIRTRPDMLKFIYDELFGEDELVLPNRFKERSESVKLEIFNTFIDLLNQTAIQTTSSTGDIVVSTVSEISYIKKNIVAIVKKLRKQLSVKSSKIRMGVFRVLRKLAISLQGGLDEFVTILLPPIKNILLEKGEQNSALKLEVLSFLRLLLKYHNASIFTKNTEILAKSIYERVNDRYYKITAEALRVVTEFVKVVAATPENESTNIANLYKNVYERLVIQDIDQDVKESAIQAMGIIISTFGAKLGPKLDECLPVLLDRLKNEITRITACKTFAQIAEAKVNMNARVLSGVLEELAEYLKKFNRPLRQASLTTLRIFAKNYGATITQKQFSAVLAAIQQNKLISDADLHLAHLALDLVAQILESNPKVSSDVSSQIQPKMIELLGSTTLQGFALDSLLGVFKKLVPIIGFSSLFSVVAERASSAQSKQVFTNVGKSIATLCASGSEKDTQSTVAKFTKDLKNDNESVKLLALFTLGEIGRNIDLGTNKTVINDIEAFFDTGSEELKNASSYALGNISVGSLEKILPHILGEIKSNEKRKYLLLHSLKEVISQASADKLAPFVSQALELLFENCENEEEGIRNVVSECLGKLALVDYANVVPKLKLLLQQSELKKSAAISAIKFTITDHPRDIDTKLKADIQSFLKYLGKAHGDSLIVRRSAVLLLNSAAHNKPVLIRDKLDSFLTSLYQECIFDKNLIKIIKLGPFNHQIDQGLELRKSAFECLDTVLDSLKDRIDAVKFIQQIPLGLSDPNADIKQLSHLIVGKIVNYFPEDVASSLDALLSQAKSTLSEKQKDNLVQQEQERQDELFRSALKAVYLLTKVKGIEESAEFQELNTKIIPQNPKFKQWYQQIKEQEEEQTNAQQKA